MNKLRDLLSKTLVVGIIILFIGMSVVSSNGYVIKSNHNYFGNQPPEAPVIDGPHRWPVGKELCFTFHSTDPDNDSVKYIINWGDGTTNETDFTQPCTPVEVCHTWDKMGTYVIKVWAVDEWGNSDWSEFEITIPRTRAINSLFQWFLDSFPLLEKLLNLLK